MYPQLFIANQYVPCIYQDSHTTTAQCTGTHSSRQKAKIDKPTHSWEFLRFSEYLH